MIELHDTKEASIYQFVIKTDITDPRTFIHEFSDLLVNTIVALEDKDPEVGLHIIDWPYLLRNFHEILCKYKGYKANVIQKTITISPGAVPNGPPTVATNDKGQFIVDKDDEMAVKKEVVRTD